MSQFKKLQNEWYGRLKKDGFEDIEDHTQPDLPLKRWSGIAGIAVVDLLAHQEAGMPIQSSFPEKRFIKEERLLNHAEFDDICRSLCSHGNHKLVAAQVRTIWELYVEGATNRAIAAETKINHVAVFRCIVNLTKWSEAMGND